MCWLGLAPLYVAVGMGGHGCSCSAAGTLSFSTTSQCKAALLLGQTFDLLQNAENAHLRVCAADLPEAHQQWPSRHRRRHTRTGMCDPVHLPSHHQTTRARRSRSHHTLSHAYYGSLAQGLFVASPLPHPLEQPGKAREAGAVAQHLFADCPHAHPSRPIHPFGRIQAKHRSIAGPGDQWLAAAAESV